MFFQRKTNPTILEINLKAIIHNLNYFRSLLKPNVKIICMIKANGYGLGAHELSKTLQNHGVEMLGVAIADEGVHLRKKGIHLPIMVLNTELKSLSKIIKHYLEPCIYNQEILQSMILVSKRKKTKHYPIHLKIDTGMHRLGLNPEEIPTIAEILKSQENVSVQSVFSHLVATDNPSLDAFTNQQIQLFTNLSSWLKGLIKTPFQRHILNSAGIERFPEAQLDMVRLGIGLYGISAKERLSSTQPIATFKTKILQIRQIKKEETVGYDRNGVVDRDSRIACLPVGYADGFNRLLSNRLGQVLVGKQLCSIIGNICMDSCMIDVTDIPSSEIKEGDEVEIFGEHIPITSLAQKLKTIPYEILTSVSPRVKRIYVEK